MSNFLSLNEIESEFTAEDLEPRLEMQMLGLAFDPAIKINPDGSYSTTVYRTRNGRVTKIV